MVSELVPTMDNGELDLEFRKEVFEILARHESRFERVNATLQVVVTKLQAMLGERNAGMTHSELNPFSFKKAVLFPSVVHSGNHNDNQVISAGLGERQLESLMASCFDFNSGGISIGVAESIEEGKEEIPDPVYDEYLEEEEGSISLQWKDNFSSNIDTVYVGSQKDEVDSRLLIPEASGLLQYSISKAAIGKFVSSQCAPVREDYVWVHGHHLILLLTFLRKQYNQALESFSMWVLDFREVVEVLGDSKDKAATCSVLNIADPTTVDPVVKENRGMMKRAAGANGEEDGLKSWRKFHPDDPGPFGITTIEFDLADKVLKGRED